MLKLLGILAICVSAYYSVSRTDKKFKNFASLTVILILFKPRMFNIPHNKADAIFLVLLFFIWIIKSLNFSKK